MSPARRLAVTLRASDDDLAPILALQDRAERLEDAPSVRALGYAPHLTLGLFSGRRPEDAQASIASLAVPPSGFTLEFLRLRYFDGPSLVVWLEPEPHAALHRMQSQLVDAMGPGGCDPHYTPDAWVPHCSIALAVPPHRLGETRALCAAEFKPFRVRFDRLDCVEFPPVEIVSSRKI